MTQTEWDAWLSRSGQPERALETATDADRHQLAYDLYYKPLGLDAVPAAWALVLFDMAYNLAWGSGVKIAQAVLYGHGHDELTIDGNIGPETRDAMNSNPELAPEAAHARIGYHVARTLPSEIHGVVNRCEALYSKAASLLGLQ